jgi:hypothetical protein
MWGTSFADLAKKAQELQEQASEAASGFSVQVRGHTFLFAIWNDYPLLTFPTCYYITHPESNCWQIF